MKEKRCKFLVCLLLLMCFLDTVKITAAEVTVGQELEIIVPDVNPPTSYEEVTRRLLEWESIIPTGTHWDNDFPYGPNGYLGKSYIWKGRYIAGRGCAAFAYILSDVAFGNWPATQYTNVTFEDIRVGDIIRINEDTHYIIVIQKNSNNIVIAEGNAGGYVSWRSIMSKQEVMDKITYLETRYPENFVDGGDPIIVPSPEPTMDPTTTSTYIYAKKQKQDGAYRYLFDSKGDNVDSFYINSGKLIYKGKNIKINKKVTKKNKIIYADFNESGNIIIILKNEDYYVINHNTLKVEKLGTKAKSRQRYNGLTTHIIKKGGKKVDVSKK